MVQHKAFYHWRDYTMRQRTKKNPPPPSPILITSPPPLFKPKRINESPSESIDFSSEFSPRKKVRNENREGSPGLFSPIAEKKAESTNSPSDSPFKTPLATPKRISNTRSKGIITPGRTGLRNLGNTCFMNSVLQSLGHNRQFREFFMKKLLPPGKTPEEETSVVINSLTFKRLPTVEIMNFIQQKKKGQKYLQLDKISVAMQLHALLRVLWSGKLAVVSPYAILDAIWTFVPKFRNYQQQDAEEFLCQLLDRLHLELVSVDPAHQNVVGGKEESTKNSNLKSVINDIFQGKLSNQIECLGCKSVSKNVESFLDLPVDIPVLSLAKGRRTRNAQGPSCSCTLEECLSTITAPEVLKDSWICEKCKKQDAVKCVKFLQLPQVICFVLKRFCWTSTSRAKVNTKIVFPIKGLDLGPFTCSKEEVIYDLQSIVMHHGMDLQAGHYTAYCYNHEADTWEHYNDAQVHIVLESEVLESEPYILFYERREQENKMETTTVLTEEQVEMFQK
eukprot:TRINITY_DN2571_c0_g6_i2.p1 TRINITY_DN2571_c0_g6~~TRINITY_DN2571_c0_g6_i2.p1  ORF type:complete len:505 (-),score=160.84 TRINITY_DN2571_c0_g6_i2:19-1533(-)